MDTAHAARRRLMCLMLLLAAPWSVSEAQSPTVELLDPGEGQRRVLRYAPEPGAKQDLTMRIGMQMTLSSGSQTMPQQTIPVMEMIAEVEVGDIEDDGTIHYSMTFTEARSLPTEGAQQMVIDAIDQQLQGLVGATGSAVVSNRGVTREASFELPPDAAPQLRQMLASFEQSVQSMSAPLPEEPVGKGASWRTTTTLEQSGMTLEQTSVTELLEILPRELVLGVELVQTAEPQVVSAPNMPPGAKTTLSSFEGAGEGTIRLDERRIVPTRSNIEVQVKTEMTVEMQGRAQQMTTELEMSVELEGTPPG